jgi:enamine deaminase RidA (YjgF/YER057c/UK114 family)
VIGFSRAVRVGQQVFVAATAPIWPDGSVEDDVAAQCRRSLQIIENALHQVDAAIGDVVRTRVYLIDRVDGEAVGAVHGEVFGEIRPATGFIVVRGFLDPRWRVEIEADAVVTRC